MLDHADVAHYLLSLGLVNPSAVVQEDLAIVDASRRNRVFLVATGAGPTYVVKQAGPGSARTLAHEAAVLRILGETTALAEHVPTVVHHDAPRARLILRTARDARDWDEHHSGGGFPRTTARLLGRTLASLHGLPSDWVEHLPPGVTPMWGLSLAEPPHELVLDLSGAAQDLVARLQASGELCARLEELRSASCEPRLVHGDLRWANCLAVPAPGSRRRTRVLLVDWELAGPGSPAFDVGSVLAEYLRFWVASVPIVDPADPGRLVAQAGYPLRRMRPAIQAFWSAYRRASPVRLALRRVVELAAVRVLQSAVEGAQESATASAHAITLAQVADNMLRAPDEAAVSLLGLRE